MPITLVLHGGSGTIRTEDRQAYQAGIRAALGHGFECLQQGESALEAAVAAVIDMENNAKAFNAGTGGSPNRDGLVECDAAVMNGADRSSGAVAALTRAKNPILIADKVRRESPHVFIVGEGADALVEAPIENAELLTERTRAALERWRVKKSGPVGSATVGAVALDGKGHLAAATSTGGVLGKWPGRVGDSPLIGAGTYADEQIAVSCTGKGEAFTRAVTAKTLAALVAGGQALDKAVNIALDEVLSLKGNGGLISLTADGRLCVGFNAPHMAYAWKTETSDEATVGLEPGLYGL